MGGPLPQVRRGDRIRGAVQSGGCAPEPVELVKSALGRFTALDRAFDEAMTAAQALRLDSARHVAVYEDLGGRPRLSCSSSRRRSSTG